ncbi:MAG: isoprenyl transferase [Candidatus Omnitrophica bacterium]|nr:isoprenyl transferase [Candidatus Omnitrophota bacterium]
MNNSRKIPQHVAIIMDGNGRWARSRGLPRIAGHRAGVKSVQEAIKAARKFGVKVLTLYTFSTENWKRPRIEVNALFALLEEYLDKEENKLNENNIRLSVIGKTLDLPRAVQDKLSKIIGSTRNNTGLILNLALNYGSRSEMIGAVRDISKNVASGVLRPEDIDEAVFSKYLYTRDMPDPDLLIRTSGEYRVSNFLLWQIAYSEIYITKKLWPDFRKSDFKKAIEEYQKRERRFGG